MPFTRFTLYALLFVAVTLPLPAQSSPSAHFPTVTAYSLAKTKITLPADLSGNRDLLLLSFHHGDTPGIDHWASAARTLTKSRAGLAFYLLPISQQKNPLYRWWDNSAMRSDFPNPQLRARVIPLYVNEKRFRRELRIPTGSRIVVLLIDRKGNVLWRASGAPDQRKLAELRATLHS